MNKFKMPFYPFSSYVALAFLAFVIVLMAFIDGMNIALFVAPVWFALLFVGFKIKGKSNKNPVGSGVDKVV